MKHATLLITCLTLSNAQFASIMDGFTAGILNGIGQATGSNFWSNLASGNVQAQSSTSNGTNLSSGTNFLGVDLNDLATAAMVTSTIFEQIPIATMTAGLNDMKNSGLLKQANVGSKTDEQKRSSLPPSGTRPAKGMCYSPSMAEDGTIIGGFTVCIPSESLNLDSSKPDTWPRLGWSDKKTCPAQCKSKLMSKGSSFDGYYCATSQYSDPSCLIDKLRTKAGDIIFEGRLVHDTVMNNVLIRCMISPTADGLLRATTDVQYEISVETVANSDASVAAQSVDVLNLFPVVLSSNNVGTFFEALGANVTNLSPQSSTGNSTTNYVDDRVQSATTSVWFQTLKSVSDVFTNQVIGNTKSGSDLISQSGPTFTNTTIGNLASLVNSVFANKGNNTDAVISSSTTTTTTTTTKNATGVRRRLADSSPSSPSSDSPLRGAPVNVVTFPPSSSASSNTNKKNETENDRLNKKRDREGPAPYFDMSPPPTTNPAQPPKLPASAAPATNSTTTTPTAATRNEKNIRGGRKHQEEANNGKEHALKAQSKDIDAKRTDPNAHKKEDANTKKADPNAHKKEDGMTQTPHNKDAALAVAESKRAKAGHANDDNKVKALTRSSTSSTTAEPSNELEDQNGDEVNEVESGTNSTLSHDSSNNRKLNDLTSISNLSALSDPTTASLGDLANMASAMNLNNTLLNEVVDSITQTTQTDITASELLNAFKAGINASGLNLNGLTVQSLGSALTAQSADGSSLTTYKTSRTTVPAKVGTWTNDAGARAKENAAKVAAAEAEKEKDLEAQKKEADRLEAARKKDEEKAAAAAAKEAAAAEKAAAAAAKQAQKDAEKKAKEEAAYKKAMEELLQIRDGHLQGLN